MVRTNIVAGLIALASLAGAANAGTITITGYTAGGAVTSASTVSVNGVASGSFNLSSGGDTMRGVVNASNIISGTTQVLTLTLTSKYGLFKNGFGPFAPDVVRLPIPQVYRTPAGMTSLYRHPRPQQKHHQQIPTRALPTPSYPARSVHRPFWNPPR